MLINTPGLIKLGKTANQRWLPTQGKKTSFLSKTMLNWSTMNTLFKNIGQWAQNVMRLMVLFVTQI